MFSEIASEKNSTTTFPISTHSYECLLSERPVSEIDVAIRPLGL